jgi:hypothetical protein
MTICRSLLPGPHSEHDGSYAESREDLALLRAAIREGDVDGLDDRATPVPMDGIWLCHDCWSSIVQRPYATPALEAARREA